MTVFAPSHELSELDPIKRVRYSLGMIVGDDELRQDQRYLMARDDRHQRALHGWGVVSGLELVLEDDGHLEVHPGAAIDGTGRWIGIDVTQCADLLPWLTSRIDDLPPRPETVTVWVLLCYDECAADPIPVPSGPCRTLDASVQPSRVKDSFRLELTLDEPPVRGDLAEFPEAAVMAALLEEDATLEDKRAALSEFVTSRGDPDGFANRWLDPLDPGCVVLGRVEVPLVDDGGALAFGDDLDEDSVSFADRPLVLSTQFIQEWLLRVEGGGTVVVQPDPTPVPFPLDRLTDVDAPSARAGNVIVGTVADADVGTNVGTDAPPPNPRWQERRLDLNLLADVQIPANFGSSPADTGLVLKYDGAVWRPQVDIVGTTGPAPEHEPHVKSRPAAYAIVAGGVVELEFNEDGFLENLTQRTMYGALKVAMIERQPIGALLSLHFPGYVEALDAFRHLEGRQFVVKLTPEADGALIRTQVVRLTEESIVVFVGRPRDRTNDEFRELVIAGLGRDDLNHSALHVEISVFDDRDNGGLSLRAVPELLQDV